MVSHRDRPDPIAISRIETGGLIREARSIARLTQAQLADAVGTMQSVVSRWERGVDEPRISTLARIFRACGFEADLSFRRHDDVDRSQLALHLALTPGQRASHHRSGTQAIQRAHRARLVTDRG
ncbi:MAG: helix-turn-helix transcriptional regulator [Acidimicrobiia bacterium]